jgi:RNA polymerase sigma-70 factor (ECF subfamily)
MSELTNLLERLYGRCQEGDPAAFDTLFEACMGRVYRLAAAILGDDKDAEDATQETLLRVFRQFKLYRREASFETWLATITVNVCRDALRRQKLRRTISLEWLRNRADPDQTGVSNLVDQRLQNQALWRLVNRMDEKHRLPLLLVYQENLPAAEAAQVLNLPIRTLYARLKHAYDELSVQLEGQALPEAPEMVVNDVQ